MAYMAFIDESGTHARSKIYSIGALIVKDSSVKNLEKLIANLKCHHGFKHELKWSRVHEPTKNIINQNIINLGVNIFYEILNRSECGFSIIVVDKHQYNNWISSERDTAFYKTFTMLIKNIAKTYKTKFEIYCDQKNDQYDKHHEVAQIIANRGLSESPPSEVTKITQVDSKSHDLIQVADFITGAINHAHLYHKNNYEKANKGKLDCLKTLSALLSWEDLAYDTFPNEKFNIWHFPSEFRGNRRSGSKNINLPPIKPIYLP